MREAGGGVQSRRLLGVWSHTSIYRTQSAKPPLAGGRYKRLRPLNAFPSVTSSAYSRSPPTGRPLASRVTTTSGLRSRS